MCTNLLSESKDNKIKEIMWKWSKKRLETSAVIRQKKKVDTQLIHKPTQIQIRGDNFWLGENKQGELKWMIVCVWMLHRFFLMTNWQWKVTTASPGIGLIK